MCLRCERHFGIHHWERVLIPWSPDLCICDAVAALLAKAEGKMNLTDQELSRLIAHNLVTKGGDAS